VLLQSLSALHLRQAARGLRRNLTFTTAVLMTLALVIGANTAVFSVVNGVLINPLPYPEPESLISVLTRAPGAPNAPGASGGITDMPESASMYVTYSENNQSFDSLGVFQPFPLNVATADGSEQIRGVSLTRGVLETLRVPPKLGRTFTDADFHAGRPDVVILGWGYWQRRFGGDPSIVGRTLSSDTRSLKVVGVMPRGFRVVTVEPDVLVPLWFDRSTLTLVFFQYEMVARLKPGVTLAQADADLGRLTYLWGGSWPMPPGYGRDPRPFDSWRFASGARPLKDGVVGGVANVLWLLMATIGIVMLIACANVANLVLVRSEGRQQEFAVRMALGAGRGRLIGEWLLESVLLGLLGGVLGTAIAYGAVRLLKASGPATLPRLEEVTIDTRVLIFALLVSILSGILFGLIPAFKYARRRLSGMLMGARGASESRERLHTRNGLVVAQVALALVLLVSSGLMIRTFLALRDVVPGFDTAQLQTIGIAIPTSAAATPDQTAQLQKTMLEELRSIPGVTAVALANAMPMGNVVPNGFGSSRMPLVSERDTSDQARNRQLRMFKYVSPDYFRTAGTRVVAGREYTWDDLEGLRPVAIVSKNLAIEQWGSPAAALGQRVQPDPNASWREVVGVVEDVREDGVHNSAPPIVYWPSRVASFAGPAPSDALRRVVFMVRSPRAGSQGLIDAIRQRLSSVNGGVPVSLVVTMQEVYDASMTRTSFALVMLGIAASMALVLGLVGIYGVIAYAATRRTREVGIRLTLGAQQREVRGMFIKQGLVLTGIGIAIGLGTAAGVMRLMTSLLFEVSPVDPLTYLVVALVLMTTTLLASYIPARRISRVDPAMAMRAE
jgi:putative ABC transport system permease protein